MNYRILIAAGALAAALALVGCDEQPEVSATKEAAAPAPSAAAPSQGAPDAAMPAPNVYSGKVLETMDAAGYTYVQIDTGTQQVWAAAPQTTVAVGDEVTVPGAMPMANYHSKTLDRTFDVVYFAGAIAPAGAAPAAAAPGMGSPHGGAAGMPGGMPGGMGSAGMHPGGQIGAGVSNLDFSGLTKADGGSTVSELLTASTNFSGKEVAVRGKVVKFNAGIMGKNWLHVQDGSGDAGSNDITVTTDATVEVGNTVLIKGVAATDKDFGYGYKYAFIIEDAKVTVE